MSSSHACPQCNSPLPADAPSGLCPRCLLQLGFESQPGGPASQPTSDYQPRWLPPSVEQLTARFPQLEILERIGQGGMGVVYKARQKDLDRIVALKILRPDFERDPAFAERFVREARALARLNHPAIVTVHDFGRSDGFFYFVMEYVEGTNLRELERSGKLGPREALAIVPKICEALQYAHDQGVVHRDIKPENILIDREGRVKIADFGLAKMVGAAPDAAALTGTWQVMGTPHYMAPEQMQAAQNVDHRADIYSLGVVIYELLTGELPIGRFPLPSQKMRLDVRLDEVVLRALERQPERRYQNASEVKTDLEAICGLPGAAAQRLFGREFRSKTTMFGLPLVHIAFGLDPMTGRPRTAKGIIAIGDRALGVVAIGGAAAGGLAIGGAAVGLLSLGGLAVGILAALGGMAIGGVAFGGGAIGIVAIGGGAVGVYAFGGEAWGMHVLSAEVKDAEAARFFEPWAMDWTRWLTWVGIGMPVFGVLLFCVIWLAFYFQHRDKKQHNAGDSESSNNKTPQPFLLGGIRLILVVLYVLCFWIFFGSQGSGGPGLTRLEYTVGTPLPWYKFQHEADSHQFAILLLSPAWLVALAAFGILHLLLRVRPADVPISRWERPGTHAALWFLAALIGTTWGFLISTLAMPEEAGATRVVGVVMIVAIWLAGTAWAAVYIVRQKGEASASK